MSKLSEIVEQAIKSRLRDELRKSGFRVSGRTFRKAVRETIHIVSIQGDRWNMPNFGQFSLDFGIYIPRLAEIHPYQTGKKTPAVRDCLLQETVSIFQVDIDSTIELLGAQIYEAWNQHYEAWFSKLSIGTNMVEFLLTRRHFPMAAASACLYLNDSKRAKEISEEVLKNAPQLSSFISNWTARNQLK